MNDLINSIFQIAKQIFGSIGKAFDALNGWLGKLWWLLLSFIITPISWLIDSATQAVEFATQSVVWVQSQVVSLGITEVGSTWESFGYFLGVLDNFVPVLFGFFVAAVLLGLWIVCTFVRIVIRCIPTAG